MATIPKLIRTLKTRANLQEFTHYVQLSPDQLLYDIWLCVQELVFLENSYEIMLEIFTKTLYFFPNDLILELEQKYIKLIKELSNALNTGNAPEIKSKLYSAELKNLLLDIQDQIEPSEESWVQHFESLFKFIGISIIEISDTSKSPAWDCGNELLQINLFERQDEIFFLISKSKLNLPKSSSSDKPEPNSPLLCTTDSDSNLIEKLDQLEALNYANDSLIDNSESEEEPDWQACQSVLNNNKPPLLSLLPESQSPPIQLKDLSLSPPDLKNYSSALPLSPSKFITSLVLNLVSIFNKHNLYHISLQIITNTLYYFPFSHNREFEQKHLKLTQDLIQAFNSENSEKIENLVSSPELCQIFQEIEENIQKNETSLIIPVYPLIKSWKISLIEKNASQEYIWNVSKPLAKFVLYLFKDQIYLLEPAGKLNLKELRVSDGDLIPGQDKFKEGESDDLVGVDVDEDALDCREFEDDLLENSYFDDDLLLSTSAEVSFEPKNVKFKPDLTIDLEKLKDAGNFSPSPTLRSALKRNTNLSPEVIFDTKAAQNVEYGSNFKSSGGQYPPLAKSGKK